MRRGGYAFFASRRCDIFTADLCNSIMPKRPQFRSLIALSPSHESGQMCARLETLRFRDLFTGQDRVETGYG